MAYFETLKVLDGKVQHPSYHVQRARRTQEAVYGFSTFSERAWEGEMFPDGLLRLRVDYAEEVFGLTVQPYTLMEHTVLPLVDAGDFLYQHKSADRHFFSDNLQNHPGHSDLLFHRTGQVLDTTICNVAVFDGNKWYTPTTYLLAGTKRAALLDEGKIVEKEISLADLSNFSHMAFLNAMRDFERTYTFSVQEDSILLQPSLQPCKRM